MRDDVNHGAPIAARLNRTGQDGTRHGGAMQDRARRGMEAGILVVEPMVLEPGYIRDEVEGEWLHVPADGRRGGSSRVWKKFPVFLRWGGLVQYLIFDDTITTEVFEEHLHEAGKFIGVGRFRPRNNGFYGRFDVESIAWS